ncbi:MAG: DUF177 domain-containing protein [bacterium]
MKIKISDIPDEGLDIEFKENPSELNLEHVQLQKLEEVKVNVRFKKEDFGFLAFGEINVKWDLICNRCLTFFPQKAKIEFNREYRLKDEEIAGDEIEEEELSTVFIKNEEINLEKDIREDLLLAIPIQTLCKTECKGICSHCGENLNIKKCNCIKGEIDSRWEALAEIKKKFKKI